MRHHKLSDFPKQSRASLGVKKTRIGKIPSRAIQRIPGGRLCSLSNLSWWFRVFRKGIQFRHSACLYHALTYSFPLLTSCFALPGIPHTYTQLGRGLALIVRHYGVIFTSYCPNLAFIHGNMYSFYPTRCAKDSREATDYDFILHTCGDILGPQRLPSVCLVYWNCMHLCHNLAVFAEFCVCGLSYLCNIAMRPPISTPSVCHFTYTSSGPKVPVRTPTGYLNMASPILMYKITSLF